MLGFWAYCISLISGSFDLRIRCACKGKAPCGAVEFRAPKAGGPHPQTQVKRYRPAVPTPLPRYIWARFCKRRFYCFVELLALPTGTPRLFGEPDDSLLVSRVLLCRWARPGARHALDLGYTGSQVHPKGEPGTPDPKPTRNSWQAQDPKYTKTPLLL